MLWTRSEGEGAYSRKEQEWLREEEVGMRMENSRESHWDSSLRSSALRQRIQMSKPYALQVTSKLLVKTKTAINVKNRNRARKSNKRRLIYRSVARLSGQKIHAEEKMAWLLPSLMSLILRLCVRQLEIHSSWPIGGMHSLFCKVSIIPEGTLSLGIQQ